MLGRSASYTVDAHVAVAQQRAFEITGPIDPTRWYPKHGPLPAVVAVENQTGSWDAPGRTRTLLLSDGGHVVETITDAASPEYFAYELKDFQKLFGRLVSGARAEWRFERDAGGTSIRWTYTFFALPGRIGIVAAIVKLFWAPYMRRVLPPIAREVERLAGSVS
ncbi:MAG: SRPBCC family protein [Salinibacterium sp.]|nr:SRPBCC family protein [Salinibacterium sp.]